MNIAKINASRTLIKYKPKGTPISGGWIPYLTNWLIYRERIPNNIFDSQNLIEGIRIPYGTRRIHIEIREQEVSQTEADRFPSKKY